MGTAKKHERGSHKAEKRASKQMFWQWEPEEPGLKSWQDQIRFRWTPISPRKQKYTATKEETELKNTQKKSIHLEMFLKHQFQRPDSIFFSDGIVVSRTSKEPTTARPSRTRHHHLRGRSCTATVAFLSTAKVCRSSRSKRRQVTSVRNQMPFA